MNKHLKLVCVLIAAVATFSSCKKTTDLSILTGHKWVEKTDAITYSDSAGVSHNQLGPDTGCQGSGYVEFHDYTSSDPLRLMYIYFRSNCPGQTSSPTVNLYSWNIDPDNTILYLYGNSTGDGSGGIWYNIQTLSSSSLVVTIATSRYLNNTGPGNTPVYDTQTETWSYGTK